MINEKPPAPEEVGKYLFNLARVRKYDLDNAIVYASVRLKGHRDALRECEAEMVALEREAFVLTKWTQDQ